jgi:Fe2+ or Zn2+ uptake regulation protein
VRTETTSDVDTRLRKALEANGQRFTEQRAAVYRFLRDTDRHPSADDVFTSVRGVIPDISLATVYKSLETHPHARCRSCGTVLDLPGHVDSETITGIGELPGFAVEGYRLELVGVCGACQS